MQHTIQQHIDGNWHTSESEHKGHLLQIKMSTTGMSGAKIHVWNTERTKVIKTFRYHFAKPEFLLNKAINYIDKKKK